jgi:hypothetical protein
MDSLIEKHIEQLSSAGDAGWQPQGSKTKERAQRKECVLVDRYFSAIGLNAAMSVCPGNGERLPRLE